jgi:predicted phosphodiesterase
MVVIAGDVVSGGGVAKAIDYIRYSRLNRNPVIFVPGNHEYYGCNLLDERVPQRASQDNIWVLDGYGTCIKGVRFWGGTMWTDFELLGDRALAMSMARFGMNDYRCIRQGNVDLEPVVTAEIHRTQRAALSNYLRDNGDGETVVVTHTGPSEQSISPRYRNNAHNAAFASDMEPLIRMAKLWVHGHTHSFVDYTLGGCRVVCNPVGYAGEETGFTYDFVVEV